MRLTALHPLLWLLTALTPTTQELAELIVSPKIIAECKKQVTLNCNVSSRNGLSIKRMDWYLNGKSLCSVNSTGNIHYSDPFRNFHCEYNYGELSLILGQMQPQESEPSKTYRCKLKSNKGILHSDTTVELQECCGSIVHVSTDELHICTFNRVYPDGDVLWFQDSNNPVDSSLYYTTKQVVEGGWLTIRGHLKRKGSDMSYYNCSLMSTRSGRHIASTVVHQARHNVGSQVKSGVGSQVKSGVGSQGPVMIFSCISILLAVTLKEWIYQS